MIIQWLLPWGKIGAGGGGWGERKERFSNCCVKLRVVEGLVIWSLLSTFRISIQLMTPGLKGQCDGLDMPGRWPGLTSGSPTPAGYKHCPGEGGGQKTLPDPPNQSGASDGPDAVIMSCFVCFLFPQQRRVPTEDGDFPAQTRGQRSAGEPVPAPAPGLPTPGTRTGGEDENRPGFIHFVVNRKTKNFIFLLFGALRGWFFLLPEAQAATNCLALSRCFVQTVNLDFGTRHTMRGRIPNNPARRNERKVGAISRSPGPRKLCLHLFKSTKLNWFGLISWSKLLIRTGGTGEDTGLCVS